MGCITSKNRIRQTVLPSENLNSTPLDDQNVLENKKSDLYIRGDGGSTLCTRSHNSLQSNMFLKKTLSFSTNCSSIQGSGTSTLIQQIKAFAKTDKDIPGGVKIRGTWKSTHFDDVVCEESSLPFYIQMVCGYPYQNIKLTQVSQIKPFSLQSSESQLMAMTIKQQVSIFLKFILQCPHCYKLTTVTQCCSVFSFSTLNCGCGQGDISQQPKQSKSSIKNNKEYVSVSLLKKQPSNVRIWSDDLQSFVFDNRLNRIDPIYRTDKSLARQEVITIKKQSKLRVFGCTSCWSFMNLKQRTNLNSASAQYNKQNKSQKRINLKTDFDKMVPCLCAICSKCLSMGFPACEICTS